MSIFLDAAVILIISLTSIAGFHKGFIKYIISLLGTVAAIIIAFAAADFLTDPVYEKYVKEPLTSAVETAADSIDVVSLARKGLNSAGIGDKVSDAEIQKLIDKGGSLADNIENLIVKKGDAVETAKKAKEKFSSYMNDGITDKLNEITKDERFSVITKRINISGEQLGKSAQLLAEGNKKQACEYMTESIFAPAVKSVLKVLIFMVAFIIASILVRIILYLSGIFNKFPGLNAANRFGGLALGFVKGCLYIALIAFLMCIVVNSTSDSMEVINAKTADQTYLFKYFFDFFYK